MKKQSEPRVAIVVDSLLKMGGAEKVLKELLLEYPNAVIYTSVSDKDLVQKEFPNNKVVNSFVKYLPFEKQLRKEYLLFYPLAFRFFSFWNFDVVISISASFAKFSRPWKRSTKHILYCLTPPRFLWLKESRSNKGEKSLSYKFYSLFMGTFLERIWQHWDKNAAKNAYKIVSISNTVKDRVKKFYGLESDVIYPPVNVSTIPLNKDNDSREKWLLYHGRLEKYKGVHLLIAACAVTHTPLKISGIGSEMENLKEMVKEYNAKGLVRFLGYLEDEEVHKRMYRCRALVFPVQDEDFGIVPVEANASGAPVIAFKSGGVTETVSENNPKTGVFFKNWDAHALADAIFDFEPDDYDPTNCRKQAELFSSEIFRYKFKNYVKDVLHNS